VSEYRASRLRCDWVDEHGEECESAADFDGFDVQSQARAAGWGWYANAAVRRDRWTTGARLWFCPVHCSVFAANHGWGDLEGYGPPTRWWKRVWRVLEATR
jgi:hypothetical protein